MMPIKTWRERWEENPVSTSRKNAMLAEIEELRAALACAAQAAMPDEATLVEMQPGGALYQPVLRIELYGGSYLEWERKTSGGSGWLMRDREGRLNRALSLCEVLLVDAALAASPQPIQVAPAVAAAVKPDLSKLTIAYERSINSDVRKAVWLDDVEALLSVTVPPAKEQSDTELLNWLEQSDGTGRFFNYDHIGAEISKGFCSSMFEPYEKDLRSAIRKAIASAARQGRQHGDTNQTNT